MGTEFWQQRGASASPSASPMDRASAKMTWTRAATALAIASLTVACTRANPGFLELDEGGSDSVESDAETGEVSAGGDAHTAGDVGGSSGAWATTGEVTTGALSVTEGSATTGEAMSVTEGIATEASATEASATEASATEVEPSSTGEPEPDPCALVPLAQHDCLEVSVLGAPYLVCQQELERPAAQAACASYCGELPTIESAEENAALHALLLDPAFTPTDEFAVEPGALLQGSFPQLSRWIGARYEYEQLPFGWEWEDGAPLQGGLWGAGEPDITGTCAVMAVWGAYEGNGRWFTRFCSGAVPYRFLCEL